MCCKTISFDTSTSNTGYAVFTDGVLTAWGTLRHAGEEYARKNMTADVLRLLKTEKPDIVVAELTCVPKNVDTQRKLDRLLGVIESWCWAHKAFYAEYQPTKWRSLAAGGEKVPQGRTDKKKWSIRRVKTLWNIDVHGDDNVSDAILIGQAYITDMLRYL